MIKQLHTLGPVIMVTVRLAAELDKICTLSCTYKLDYKMKTRGSRYLKTRKNVVFFFFFFFFLLFFFFCFCGGGGGGGGGRLFPKDKLYIDPFRIICCENGSENDKKKMT